MYLEFSAQKEFSYPLFNGYYSKVQLRVGPVRYLL